jgi:hypothetical protein
MPTRPVQHAFAGFRARDHEGIVVSSRRGMLKASLAGICGLSAADLLRARAADTPVRPGNAMGAGDARNGQATNRPVSGRSVILLWLAGGPSHIDTWDPKPDRPIENRGPFGVIDTRLPGVKICEYLPKQAAMLDKFTLIRSVDARFSNHEPNTVFQTANLEAEPRINPKAEMYPALAAVVAKHHGANQPGMPPYVAFMKSRSHLAFAGYLGKQYDPFLAEQAARLPIYDLIGNDTGARSGADLFRLPTHLDASRLDDRGHLLASLDRLQRGLDLRGSMDAMDAYSRKAVEMVTGERARQAFDLSLEPEEVRQKYGSHLWCQQALLARRLVEAGVAFVTLDLSYHTASGTWDTHGDNIPPYGGIWNGLRPLLPLFDHLSTTLVQDLEERGLLQNTLVLAMGEFGRTPRIGTQGSSDGRDHWPVVMSMLVAGGGYRHGQVIGSTESDGGQIRERPVTPGDLAATIFHHMGVPLDFTYEDDKRRPIRVISDGSPIFS